MQHGFQVLRVVEGLPFKVADVDTLEEAENVARGFTGYILNQSFFTFEEARAFLFEAQTKWGYEEDVVILEITSEIPNHATD